jgi:signal transduction histidine kinase
MGHPPPVSDEDAAHWEPGLLSSVCHDLRTPLASIQMGVGFLRKVLQPEEEAALRVVEAMHRSAQHMNHLIESFSDLAKIHAHELTLHLALHDVAAVMGTAHERSAADATTHGIPLSLENHAACAGLLLPCDRERLVQCLHHLAWCALRVVPEGGTLAMRARTGADTLVQFEVEARARRIRTELPKPELAIARGLIELHGGQLAVAVDGEHLELSFALPRERHDLSELRAGPSVG